jgi:hypothetical protein
MKTTKREKAAAIEPIVSPYWSMSLSELLKIVDSLFPLYKTKKAYSYNYHLAKFPIKYGWVFNVTSNWYKWIDANLQHQFGGYLKPEYAVAAFLDYVKEHKINVKKMAKG